MSQSILPFPRQAATRGEALAQLEMFAKRAHRYARERNAVVEGHRNVSQLSAALQHRLISQEEVVQQVLSLHAFPAVEKFLQEVLWRSYWKGWLEWRPSVWHQYQEELPGFSLDDRQRAEQVTQGKSGCAVMDDFAHELRETGYLHNHARMWWASFWIHHQKLPWALGAEFFMQHLIDADAASNTLSWRWVAGLQTLGKTYLVRRDNIERYHHAPARKGLDLLESVVAAHVTDHRVHDRIDALDLSTVVRHPLRKSMILMHEEDLSIEQTALASLRPDRLVFFDRQPSESPSPRQRWQEMAFRDAMSRAQAHFRIPCEKVSSLSEIDEMIAQQEIEQVVMMKPMVGPLADALGPFIHHRHNRSVECVTLSREEDAHYFPFARSGFFPFWKKASHALSKG